MSGDKSGSNCVICDEPINVENDSDEHVIIEAIGGRLKVNGFICKRCNNDAGHTWDAELASQLHPLSLLFGVDRQRGATPPLAITTTAGEELVIKPEGGFAPAKPSYSEETTREGVKIQITARSMKEARRMLEGVKRKYPNANIDQILSGAQHSTVYPKGMVHHQLGIGGEVSGRSIVKSVMALAHHAGVPIRACGDALNYLRDPAAPPCFGYYQATDLVSTRSAEVPLHCVSVEASPDTRLILGYAEYFGIHRVVVCLGRNYADDRVRSCYAIDPRTGERFDLSVRLAFTEAQIEDIYAYKMIPDGAIEEAVAKVMPAALKKRFEAEQDRVFKEATEYAVANCGAKPGDMLTEEHVKKLSHLMVKKLTPFILHNIARPNRVLPPWAKQDQTDDEESGSPDKD
jgi:hypothetical protein